MDLLKIIPTEFTPGVVFNPELSVFEIYGFSRPEDVAGFYKPLMKWLALYEESVLGKNSNKGKTNIVLNLKLIYFNSASSKFLLDLLFVFVKFHTKGNDLEINWHYEEDDDEILESGQELSEMIGYSFNFIPVHTPD